MMISRTLVLLAALAGASAHVCVRSSAMSPCVAARARSARAPAAMFFGKNKPDYDLTDLGPMTKEKRDVYRADRTPKTEYQPDDLAWDGSNLYLLTLPFLVIVCLSLFGGVNLFGYSN